MRHPTRVRSAETGRYLDLPERRKLPIACGADSYAQNAGSSAADVKVRAFLDRHRGTWRDLNVPESDDRLLYDLVVKNRFTRALEIGTSTGLSAIWIAWALSKTGGKLTTLEIDPERNSRGGTTPRSITSES